MHVFITGATGVLGTAAVRALVHAGHDVRGLARSDAKAQRLESLGAQPVRADLFDVDALRDAFAGCEVLCNLATHVPVGMAGVRPGAWRLNDRIHTEGAQAIAQAAKEAGVRRFIQQSASMMYADGGDELLDESSPVSVTRATEPIAEAETHATSFACAHRSSVILRFGHVVGDDPITRWRLERAASGQPIGLGDPDAWVHVVHPDDVGTAVVAALYADNGVYNVGAEPLLRSDCLAVFAHAVRRDDVGYISRLWVKLAGEHWEPMTRSHRVSSRSLEESAGWMPRRQKLDSSWLDEIVLHAA